MIQTSIGAAAATAIPFSVDAATRRRSVGANERIRIGIIGCGGRGRNAHMKNLYKHVKETNFEIIALSDPWSVVREQANGMVKEWFGRDAKTFVSYRSILDMDEIDAVTIASPDHHHTTQLEATAKAGKHVYVEKPLARDFKAMLRSVDAVKKAGIVCQVGTQVRSLPSMHGARELFKSGILGHVSRFEECRNQQRPYWYGYLKQDVKQEDVDWSEFIGNSPKRPFRADYLSGWYGYDDYTDGPIPNLGAHFIDLVHFITGATHPLSCVCLGMINKTWVDEHEFSCPNVIQATWTYPEGFLVSSSNNLCNSSGTIRKLYADKGSLDITNWNNPSYDCEGSPNRDGKIRGKNDVPKIEKPDHYLDWLQCMRTGDTPNAPIEAGYQHSVAVLMAMTSYRTGRKTIFDPVKRKITTV